MRLLIIPAVIATLIACAEDPGAGKPKAKVEDVPVKTEPAKLETPPPAATPAAGAIFKVDTAQSSIQALGAKVTAQHPIDFKEFDGALQVDGGKVTGVKFEVKMASLVSDAEKLTEHLKTPDFFDVAAHPTATFASTEIKEGSTEAGFTHTITGDFQIRGTTKRITFPAKIEATPTEVKANSEFVINRKDFNIVYAGKADDLIQDNVKMTIKLVAKAG